MIWRGAIGFIGFWLSFYALSFTPVSLNPDEPRFAWWAAPWIITFGASAVGSLMLVVNAFYHSLDDDRRALAWLLSRLT